MSFTGYSNSGLAMLGQGIDAFGNALQDVQKRQSLSALGTKLLSGDYAGAAQAAVDAGDTGTALKLVTLAQQNKPDPALGTLLTGQAAPQTGGAPAPVGGFDNAVSRTLGFEGGLNPNDSNGAPSNYGINAKANPDVNVPNLTKDQATQIYKQRYWDPLGLDSVDPKLAHVAFDTAVIAGPAKAQELMDASGGDPNKYLALRQGFQNSLLQSDPAKYGPYANAWNQRVAGLRSDINAQGAVASDDSAPSADDAATARLRTERNNLLVPLARYKNAGNAGAVEAITKKISDLDAQIKDQKEAYAIHTTPSGDMIAINKADPTKIVPINTGTKPKSQAEVDARTQIAEQLGLQGDERKQYLLNGKVPDQSRVLKPGDVLAGPQGQPLAKNESATSMNDQTADFIAERVLAGDTRALTGLGRGAQGAENISKIQGIVAQKASERGVDASDILANIAKQQGLGAQQRTFGTQTARMATASTEAEGAIKLAREASDNVWRSGFIPLTKVYQAYQANTNDPNLAKFVAAHNTVINTYARAISPTGTPTVSDKEHARELLSTAQNQQAYSAVLGQLQREIDIAHRAPERAQELMEGIRQQGKTNKTGGVVPPAEGATATGPNGQKIILQGGQWVPLQ